MSDSSDRIVQQRPDGNWEVVAPDSERASGVFDTQVQAERRAKEIVKNRGGGEVRIKGRDGKFRDSDTVPKGNESKRRDKRH
jgi:hypothetical protein